MNNFLLSVLSIGFFVSSSAAMQEKDLAHRYLDFLNVANPSIAEMELLFSPDCRKIINGATASKNIEQMQAQICKVQDEFTLQSREHLGEDHIKLCEELEADHGFKVWSIEPCEENCFYSHQNNLYVIQFLVHLPPKLDVERDLYSLEALIVIAYLKIDEDGKICEINEVYNNRDW